MASSDGSLTFEEDGYVIKCEPGSSSPISASRLDGSANASVNGTGNYNSGKDDRYWERRRKNNEAAKRSREKRRMNDIVMEKRIVELSTENSRLRNEIERLRRLYNISDSDIRVALSSSIDVISCSSSTAETGDVATGTTKRRSSNRNESINRVSTSRSRKSLRDAAACSDASSLVSSNDDVPVVQARSRSSRHAKAEASSSSNKRTRVDAELETVERKRQQSTAHVVDEQHLPVLRAVGNDSAEGIGLASSLPDLVTMLGVLQNVPLLQALVKNGQSQAQSQPLSVLQQLTTLQQLAGLSSSLLPNDQLATSSMPSDTSSTTPGACAKQRGSNVLDLSCKLGNSSEAAGNERGSKRGNGKAPANGSLIEENDALRVELDNINAQVRELKEILLQRDTVTQAAASTGCTNENTRRLNAAAAGESESDADEPDEDAAYSKRSRLAIVDDVSSK